MSDNVDVQNQNEETPLDNNIDNIEPLDTAPETGSKKPDEIPLEDKINHGVKERLDKVKTQYQSRIDALEIELAQLRQGQPGQQQPQGIEQQPQQQEQAGYPIDQAHAAKIQQNLYETAIEHDDFQQVVMSQLGNFVLHSPAISLAIEQTDNPAKFLYDTLKHNAEDLKNILKINDPRVQYLEIGKLEAKLKEKPAASSPPPAPLNIERDSGANIDSGNGSIDALIRQDISSYHKRRSA